MPPELLPLATCEQMVTQNMELRFLLDRACFQMEKDYALKVLMDKENERLWKCLYDKSKKPSKKTSGHAQHMTSEENLEALAREDWAAQMKEVFKDWAFKL